MNKFLDKLREIRDEIILAGVWLFWKRKLAAFFIWFSAVLNIVSWGFMIWLAKTSQAVVILHYNAFLGIDSLIDTTTATSKSQFFVAPLGGTIILVFNILISVILLCFIDKKRKDIFQRKGHKLKTRFSVSIENTQILGIYLLLTGNLFLQLVIIIYEASIILANS